jgi:hypothetical protein
LIVSTLEIKSLGPLVVFRKQRDRDLDPIRKNNAKTLLIDSYFAYETTDQSNCKICEGLFTKRC